MTITFPMLAGTGWVLIAFAVLIGVMISKWIIDILP